MVGIQVKIKILSIKIYAYLEINDKKYICKCINYLLLISSLETAFKKIEVNLNTLKVSLYQACKNRFTNKLNILSSTVWSVSTFYTSSIKFCNSVISNCKIIKSQVPNFCYDRSHVTNAFLSEK